MVSEPEEFLSDLKDDSIFLPFKSKQWYRRRSKELISDGYYKKAILYLMQSFFKHSIKTYK